MASLFTPENDAVRLEVEENSIEEAAAICLDDLPALHVWEGDTNKVKKNPNDRVGDATRQEYVTPLHLGNPQNMMTSFKLEDDLSGYSIYEKVGEINVRRPSFISFEDYIKYRREKEATDYFRDQSLASNLETEKGLELNIDMDALSDVFGGGTVSIRPTGYATLDFGLDRNRTDNPNLPVRQQRTTTFNFDQQIQLGVIGQIGEKLRLNANFDTQATFDFDNELKLEHQGTEDQILQDIKAGNVSMQLGNSLMQGRQNLFGLQTRLKFGPVYVSAIASTERGKVESITVSGGGAIETPFEKDATDYDMNRHFFLSHYFRSRYEQALINLPVIQSTLRINRVEIWVEQQGNTRSNRNAVGLVDLGEHSESIAQGQGRVFNENLTMSPDGQNRYPNNESNNLYEILTSDPTFRSQSSAKGAIEAVPGLRMQNTSDFQVLGNMRRLEPNEYSINTQLGYVSLNSPIPTDQVLFVAYNYTFNGAVRQVGEFSDDVPPDGLNSNVLFTKMLKPSVLRVAPYPAWDLMMKNIYNIGYGLKSDGFFLDIQYESGTSAGKINFLPTSAVANTPLIQVTGVDKVTNNTSAGPDNYFDYIEGITVKSDRGLVIFPVLEPFGDHLANRLENDPDEVAKYVFAALYDDTQQGAIQRFPELNRFTLEGYYRSSSSSEIPLNTFDLAEGSVTVTAGGRTLVEGVDFQVDYFGGKLTIINPSILTSGQDITVSFESSSLYSVQTKTLLGSRVEYSPSDNIQLGGTILNLREQPFNNKTILGDEPINNTLWGLDASIRKESDLMTKVIDKLPFLTTKETSSVNAAAEFAQFIPGAPRVVKNNRDKGIVFLDDFEAAATPYNQQGQLKWKLASYPEGNPRMFDPRRAYADPLAPNFTRAKLAWYQIDQAFYRRFGISIPDDDLEDNYTRQIRQTELFPTSTPVFGNNLQPTFDLRFLPAQRGPYNYQTDAFKLDAASGEFLEPQENWAGIMREIDINNDFEATNVEFLEFWMMDPFLTDSTSSDGGEFYINLGLISEDVLPDESLSREFSLPGVNDPPNVQNTDWGVVSLGNPPTTTFSNSEQDRVVQDVGLDGLRTPDEAAFYQRITDSLERVLSPAAFQTYLADPSSDDFIHFRDSAYEAIEEGVLQRYVNYNGMENNSPVDIQQTNRNYTIQATNEPDGEDLNRNGSLNFAEQYYEYRIRIHPDSLEPGMNFVVDKLEDVITVGNASKRSRWYQFRIPLKAGRPVNEINNFKTISFMRMYMTGFERETILRMTELQLVASQWLRFTDPLTEEGVIIMPQIDNPVADFQIGNVSIEENSQKLPFNYVLPPDVERQQLNGNTLAGYLQDERSMTIRTCGLADGDARGIFKTTKNDLRQYDRLRMWVHAEAIEDGLYPSNFYNTGDAKVFLRVGLDNDDNYYEYELPLTPSDPARGVGNQQNIWQSVNEFDFPLALFAVAKAERNFAGTGLIYRHAYSDTTMPEGHRIFIKGTPKLSDVRNIMIGVRNPSDPGGESVCLEVWVNELRLTNFDKSKGWAANANASIKLADLGTINASGSFKSSGFGPLEQKLSNRALEDALRYDISANLNMDKFFPTKWGLSLPVYATFGEQKITPQFNPQEADVRTDQLLDALPRELAREKLSQIQDYRRTRSISLNNWRKSKSLDSGGGGGPGRAGGGRVGGGRTGGRQGLGGGGGGGKGDGGKKFSSYPWDIYNFDFTFSYNEQLATNSVIQRKFNVQHRGGINYRYQFPQVQVKPFIWMEDNKLLSKLKFLTEFTLNPFPNSVSIAVAGDRQFEERLMRPTSQFGGKVNALYSKNFLVNRSYNLTWNLTRSLQFNYSANNVARVDEVQGFWRDATQQERDSIGSLRENLFHIGKDTARGHDQFVNFGRTTNFTHNFNIAFQLPFSQIKPLDWINGTINYTGAFTWQQAPEIRPTLGATIGNSQNIQANGRIDLNGLYRKFKPIKKILDGNQQGRNAGRSQARPPSRNKNQQTPEQEEAVADTTQPDPFKFLKIIGKEVLRIALSVKSVDMTYSRNNSISLPGYLPKTNNFGLDWGYLDRQTDRVSPIVPPTAAFVFGGQKDIRPIASRYNWITRDTTLANLYMFNTQEMLTARTSVELFKGFRIDISANRSLSRNESSFFRWDRANNQYDTFDPLNNGTFSMSYVFLNTAFENINADDPRSVYFEQFSDVRQAISKRYADKNPQTQGSDIVTGGFRNGYLGTNQDVLVTSLLANYGFLDADQVELSPFPTLPLPNWSVNFNGLSNIPFFKKHFNAITLKHSYRGTYSVGNFNNNLNFQDMDGDGYADIPFVAGIEPGTGIERIDYYASDNIQAVQISEQFSPLLGFNLSMKNGVTGQIDYKRGRQMTLNVGSLQLVDMRNQDLAVMLGYRKDKLDLHFRLFGRDIDLTNSANFQFQATMRDTKEINHTLSPSGTAADPVQPSQFTRGTFNLIISPSIDYVVNTRLNVKLFFERNVNRPYTSNAYNTAFTSGGVQIRFTLGT
ncbi:MAG: cell surface protein SprA [Bacteroidota bacterium]